MSDEIALLPQGADGDDEERLTLAAYAQRAYLEYALSVVKGRALPDVSDGQKPVQRRILYVMGRMGLGWGGAQGRQAASPVKSARVVGDVLGKFHPHGDVAAYEALVRMAQEFSLRYPLIDGQGNFGSRDGDGAAAMRYTEARLSRICRLLLSEIDAGTVDFTPNYDGREQEPVHLPARLPFALLNGASGIAVGLACEIPSHNLREVADACLALLKKPDLSDEELLALLPGPDYPGGGHIISSTAEIAAAYRTGRGSLKVRARWSVEPLARGQWQMVVTELPPGVSARRVLEDVEAITNPKPRAGKKSISAEQSQLKAAVLGLLEEARDESNKDAPVRIVFSPRSRSVSVEALAEMLLAHTCLESNAPINLTCVGLDGRPVQKSLRQMLEEWIAFRQQCITRRTRHRLQEVLDRLHILEGRQAVLLNIDEVITTIRESDEPKPALIARFNLSERQAEDILEIRLRQLARLEAIKIEQEMAALREEQQKLQEVLGSHEALVRLMAGEIRADAREFGDARRTLIREEKRAQAELPQSDEPLTVIVSSQGWVRSRQGHGHDAAAFSFKPGDALYGAFECRTPDWLLVFGSNGRVYSVPVASLPDSRGDGQPITSLIELEAGSQAQHFIACAAGCALLLASSDGYGFIARAGDMLTRHKAGKAFVTLSDGARLLRPALVQAAAEAQEALPLATPPATHLACVGNDGWLLCLALDELRLMPKGGKGLRLMALNKGAQLAGAAAYAAGSSSVRVLGRGRRGDAREEVLGARVLAGAVLPRARKGRSIKFGFEPQAVERVDE